MYLGLHLPKLFQIRLVIKSKQKFSTKTTVEPQQMKNFSKMAEDWWNLEGPLGPLHLFNEQRVPLIQNRLKHVGFRNEKATSSAKLSALDVGCGGGILSEALYRLGWQTTGLDACEDVIKIAKMHAKNQNIPNLRYVCETIEEHAEKHKEKYDVIVSSETIEHVVDKEDFVKYCVQCLKPGGSIFFTTPNKTWLGWFTIVILLENVFKILPKGTHLYEMFIHINDLKTLLFNENCNTVFSIGTVYNPLLRKWHIMKNENANYILHAIKVK